MVGDLRPDRGARPRPRPRARRRRLCSAKPVQRIPGAAAAPRPPRCCCRGGYDAPSAPRNVRASATLAIDPPCAATCTLRRHASIDLSQKEYAPLTHAGGRPDPRVVTKDELLRDVSGAFARWARTRTLDSHACRLRRKLAGARRTCTCRKRVGRRLPAGRRAGAMSDAVAAAGWALAVNAGLVVWLALAAAGRRRELVARACHELRGPLTAASMALHAIARESPAAAGRAAAVDLELRRAALALEDLGQAATGRRHADRGGVVDVGALVARQAEVWRDVARADGCELSASAWLPRQALVLRQRGSRLAQATGEPDRQRGRARPRERSSSVVRDAGGPRPGRGLPTQGLGPARSRGRAGAPPAQGRARRARARARHRRRDRRAPRRPPRLRAAAHGAPARPRAARRRAPALAMSRRRRAALLLGLALRARRDRRVRRRAPRGRAARAARSGGRTWRSPAARSPPATG